LLSRCSRMALPRVAGGAAWWRGCLASMLGRSWLTCDARLVVWSSSLVVLRPSPPPRSACVLCFLSFPVSGWALPGALCLIQPTGRARSVRRCALFAALVCSSLPSRTAFPFSLRRARACAFGGPSLWQSGFFACLRQSVAPGNPRESVRGDLQQRDHLAGLVLFLSFEKMRFLVAPLRLLHCQGKRGRQGERAGASRSYSASRPRQRERGVYLHPTLSGSGSAHRPQSGRGVILSLLTILSPGQIHPVQ